MSDSRPVAFVTGAARGIGRATAVEFARRGYDVALLDVLSGLLDEAANAVRAAGKVEAVTHVVDLTDLVAAEAAVRETARRFGRIDALVNNAIWRELLSMRQISLESWEKTLRIGLTAPAFLARRAAEVMEPRGRGGVIVNVSSVMSERAAGISPAYIAAKGGLDSLTYELAALYGPAGIRVVSVNPGAIDTDLSADYSDESGQSVTQELRRNTEETTPLRRFGRAEEVARVIAFLASDEASYITGTNVHVDGGLGRNMMSHSLKHRMSPQEFK